MNDWVSLFRVVDLYPRNSAIQMNVGTHGIAMQQSADVQSTSCPFSKDLVEAIINKTFGYFRNFDSVVPN